MVQPPGLSYTWRRGRGRARTGRVGEGTALHPVQHVLQIVYIIIHIGIIGLYETNHMCDR